MAAPVGHIVCALALLNSPSANIIDKHAFLVGTNFPDIRYISDVHRSTTHKLYDSSLGHVLEAPSSFEAGRRFHVFVDREREKHMQEHHAYRFIKNGPLKTQMLKLIEDHIMFDKLKDRFNAKEVFNKIYDEERAFLLEDQVILAWHNLLNTYLDQTYWFDVVRYYRSLTKFRIAYGLPDGFFDNIWLSLRTIGFFIYVYFQIEKLSRNQELKAIILDFYDNKMPNIIKSYFLESSKRTVFKQVHGPPRVSVINFS